MDDNANELMRFLVGPSTVKGEGTHVMHSRTRMAIDPRIPTMPGLSTSSFHRSGRHRVHQARSAVTWSASRMEG